jgi:hypothetical protein
MDLNLDETFNTEIEPSKAKENRYEIVANKIIILIYYLIKNFKS